MQFRRLLVLFVAVIGILAQVRGAAADPALPEGPPNLRDPATLNGFAPVGVGTLADDPDFPVLLLANLKEGSPQFILTILDARNGRETYSVREDAPVFLVLLSDPKTVQQVFLDEGFAADGKASGHFLAAGPGSMEEVLAKLREGYLRTKAFVRGQVI